MTGLELKGAKDATWNVKKSKTLKIKYLSSKRLDLKYKETKEST